MKKLSQEGTVHKTRPRFKTKDFRKILLKNFCSFVLFHNLKPILSVQDNQLQKSANYQFFRYIKLHQNQTEHHSVRESVYVEQRA